MARYRDALCKLCRRDGEKLFLKGVRCTTDKCAIDKRKYPPGQHGQRRGKLSDYAVQLKEKQKVKRIYGLLEKQFSKYFKEAEKKRGITGELLLQYLERRLDNIVYRIGFTSNRNQARQLVLHGHFRVNGKKVNIPSYSVKVGDVIEVHEASKKLSVFGENLQRQQHEGVLSWLEVDFIGFKGKVLHVPGRDDIPLAAKEQLIVEFYSR
ncbi:30S ribosomal protein S4 [Candidatus Magnetominusculus dajiuhuensis]|uniref:30S ribosomal protein S4 n=1 Tax=Candidatus Magnetominusculus dajiuhuensis TaxID=3137712 RepID=UPI0019D8C64C|nr:30S ribosomal protein S4 [Nitrospirota bacterium]